MRRFSFMARKDGRIGLFAPPNMEQGSKAQAFVLDRSTVTESWIRMLERGHGEVIPNSKGFEGLGMAFGEMSDTTWKQYVGILHKLDPRAEIQ